MNAAIFDYFELRCAVVEQFYEGLIEENYRVGQSAARCLVEFQRELRAGGADGLTVLSVLFSRVARHEPAALRGFKEELDTLRRLAGISESWRGIEGNARERTEEDVRYATERAEESARD